MRRSIREVRRAELSQAAFDVLVENGIRNTTIERVASRAGVSKSVVLHHYADKDALFQAVMRRANTLLRDGLIELLQHAKSPMERLAGIIVGHFAEPVFHQEICHVWINLCAEVPYNQESQRIQTIIQGRMHSNLLVPLRDVPLRFDAQSVARQISIAIDGIWLRASLQETPMSTREGIDAICEAVIRVSGFDLAASREFATAITKMENIAALVLNSRAFLGRVAQM